MVDVSPDLKPTVLDTLPLVLLDAFEHLRRLYIPTGVWLTVGTRRGKVCCLKPKTNGNELSCGSSVSGEGGGSASTILLRMKRKVRKVR